jgi:hypothetical protein
LKNLQREIIVQVAPEKVFAYMDNINNIGMHMIKSSKPMMSSKLELKQLSENPTGLNSRLRWFGKMMWFTMDFTVIVTKWIKEKEKVWETIGKAKIIIMGWYQMRLVISSASGGQSIKAALSFAYTKPKNISFKFIAFSFAPLYAKWC